MEGDSSAERRGPGSSMSRDSYSSRGGFGASGRFDTTDYGDLIDTMIQNDRQSSDDKGLEGMRTYAKKLLSHSSLFGQIYDYVLVVIAICSNLMYICSTYVRSDMTETRLNIHRLDILFSLVLMFDIILSLWLADQRWDHLTKITTLLNIASVIPVWFIYDADGPPNSEAVGANKVTMYIVHALATTVILRPMRIQKKIKEITNEVQRSIGDMALTIVMMILFSKY